ncbi:MAG TPA: 50S ribosomal protein L15 [Candidatus Paceibacterota bacterium]
MANLNLLKRTSKRTYRRVGRGQSSTRGKTSGRGGKGQTARAGHKIRPELRDIIKKLPKRRGYGKNRARTVNMRTPAPTAISINRLNQLFDTGAEISPKVFHERGIISARGGNTIKIVGGTEASKKFTIKQCRISASARAAVEKAGGNVMQ